MTEIEKLVEWLAETAFNAGYADCASTYDIPRRLTVIEADAANDAAKAALLAALKGAEGRRANICIGRASIALAAENGMHVYEDGDAIIAADDLFKNDPYLRAEKAERERDAAVAALVPFAEAASGFDFGTKKGVPDSFGILAKLNVGHLRQARAALASNSRGG